MRLRTLSTFPNEFQLYAQQIQARIVFSGLEYLPYAERHLEHFCLAKGTMNVGRIIQVHTIMHCVEKVDGSLFFFLLVGFRMDKSTFKTALFRSYLTMELRFGNASARIVLSCSGLYPKEMNPK